MADVAGGDGEPQEKCTLNADNETYTCTGSTLTWKKQTIDDASVTSSYFCNWNPEEGTCTKYSETTSENASTATAGDLYVSDKLTLTAADAKSAENCETSRNKSRCKSSGDYWNLARRTCEEQGGRLPTAAELKAMYKAEQLDSSSYYWAAEAASYGTDRSSTFSTYDGNVYGNYITTYNSKAVCVGN